MYRQFFFSVLKSQRLEKKLEEKVMDKELYVRVHSDFFVFLTVLTFTSDSHQEPIISFR